MNPAGGGKGTMYASCHSGCFVTVRELDSIHIFMGIFICIHLTVRLVISVAAATEGVMSGVRA